MRFRSPIRGMAVVCVAIAALTGGSLPVDAATIVVPAGGNLQTAINAAQPGDVITLAAGATYIGNFVLPNKGAITQPITIRSSAADSLLPPAGVRITPAYAAQLPKIKSANSVSSLRTAAGTNHWTLMFLEFQANQNGYGDIIELGAGDSTQTQLAQVPYQLVLDRVYIHGDPLMGQKRGVALNSSDTTVINSYISDIKAVGQDTQALGGYNGPGNYLIENNYFEAATENVLFGGSDPPIQNLVTTNITFRHNYLSKPLAWRDPIIATPTGVSARGATGGGTLPAGTYFYKVSARTPAGQTSKASSVPSVEVSATLAAGTTGAIALSWTPVTTATDYVVYGRTSGGENMYWITTSPFFTDAGTAGTAGTPAGATKWSVKNLFELKNAQDVVVEGNVFENLWVADQGGYPIVFTPRNQNGTAPWVVVQRVVFQHNLIRHTAGGVNILGTDNLAPSQLTNHLTVANNVFDDLTGATWGSGSRPFQIGDGGDAFTIDHNTMITTDSSIVGLYGGSATSPTPITNAVYTNNMSAHNTYGIFGANMSAGNLTINAYWPGGIVSRNILAGGPASKYPAGNFFPTVAAWQAEFVNYIGGDYHLLPTSSYKNAGTDGTDLGADVDALNTAIASAISGDNRGSSVSTAPQVQITTTTLPDASLSQPYAQTLTCTGGTSGCAWQVVSATLPAGITFDPVAAVVMGTPTTVETGALTVQAYDPLSPSNAATRTLSLTVDPPPFVVTVPAAPAGQVGASYRLVATASGAMGSVTWSVASGTLPIGLTLDPQMGSIAGTPSAWGTTTALIEGQDSWSADRTDSKPVTITVAPMALAIDTSTLANGGYQTAYNAQLAATGGTGSTNWSLIGGALPQGVTLAASGSISGTPAVTGTFSFTVQATDANWPANQAAATLSLTIASPTLSVSVPSAPMGRVGLPYQLVPAVSGQVGSVAWSIASGALPSGVGIDAVTGIIAGTPTMWGTFTAAVQVRDASNGAVASASVTIVVAPTPIVITSGTLAAGTVNVPYSTTLTAAGGTGAAAWSIVNGSMPAGLTLSAAGLISGTPTTAGTATFTVQASDAGWPGNFAAQSMSISIAAAAVALPSPWAHRDIGSVGVAGDAQYSDAAGFTVTASGADVWGTADAFHYVYQPWTGDGSIVTRVASVTNANSWSKAGVMFRETLTAGSAQAFMLVSAAKGAAYQRREMTGGVSVSTSGSLSAPPRWLRLDRSGDIFTAYESADGAAWTLVGTDTIPMAQQIYVGVAVTSHDNTRTTTATLTAQPVVTTAFAVAAPSASAGQVGVPYQIAATATGQVGTVNWSIASGALPAGLSLDAGSGIISGTPNSFGTFIATIQGQDSYSGRIASAPMSIAIAPTALTIATPPLPGGQVGVSYQAALTAIGGTGATTWSIVAGALPSGLTLDASGAISGTPTTAGTAAFTAQATDAGWPGNLAAQSMTITIASAVVTLPSPWAHRDIGSVGVVGDAQYSDAAGFTVTASGADVWGNADAFHFVYQPWTGDGSIVTRVASVTNANAWSKAGVMFRESLTAGSAHAFVLVSAAKGVAYQRRELTGGVSVSTAGSLSAPPRWLRLDRSGNTFSAYESADGATWTLVGRDTIAMAPQIYVGVAATSHDNTRTTTATLTAQPTASAPLSILTPTLPDGQVGVGYQTTLSAAGGTGTLTWSISSGALPAGLALSPAGIISGTPSSSGAGVATFTVQVRDASGKTAGKTFSLTVARTHGHAD
jgi:regulation of enolase protein 1 (concanavalin A-like superfamily)